MTSQSSAAALPDPSIGVPAVNEVELKLYLGARSTEMIARCEGLGWEPLGEEDQEDVYFTSRYRDLIENEECLRIRRTSQTEQLTWKPGTTGSMREQKQFWKPEIDIDVTGQSALLRVMFKQLDFEEYVVVRKQRTAYRVDAQSSVAIDIVEPLGCFLEIETQTESPKLGVRRNWELAQVLRTGRAEPINRPYRDLVKLGRVPSLDPGRDGSHRRWWGGRLRQILASGSAAAVWRR